MAECAPDIFEDMESNVRSYCRGNPTIFDRAEGAYLFDEDDNAYLDFLSGAGSLNYGHNNPALREKLVSYISGGGVTHSLDFHTTAKAQFLESFKTYILEPREYDYMVQFTGPTGANAVEAAFKLARKVTGRSDIIAFTNGFHGVTTGALAATGNSHHRGGAGLPLTGVTRMPFDGYLGENIDTLDLLEKSLTDGSSGIDLPAAIVVETIQGEGGLNSASKSWMQRLASICQEHKILLIVDDIQAGCGRSGSFFSFEDMGIKPDIVTLSKSLSGFGLPFAVVLLKPELDCWKPGEHNGTFRGNNHAFVTAEAALDAYWKDDSFQNEIAEKANIICENLNSFVKEFSELGLTRKGRGMMQGLSFEDPAMTREVASLCQKKHLVIETSGPDDEVLKCFPPLTISEKDLKKGLSIIHECVKNLHSKHKWAAMAAE